MIDRFFQPLRAEINQGRYDYNVVKAWSSATNLLDMKIKTLLDKALQKESLKEKESVNSDEDYLSNAVHLLKAVRPFARPLSKSDLIKAYTDLMVYRKKKRIYSSELERMDYVPVEIEPISIEIDKEKLLQKIKAWKMASLDLQSLLEKKTWQEVIELLNILVHLAQEGKIKLRQDNFPEGKIIITSREDKA